MNARIQNSFLTLAFLTACSATAVAQDDAIQLERQERALDAVTEWVADDATRMRAALDELGIAEDEATTVVRSADPLVGTYKLRTGFGKPRVTVSIAANEDGTYAVDRVHEPRWGETIRLQGTAQLGQKRTLTNKSVLSVTFREPCDGATGHLRSLDSLMDGPEDNPYAVYKLDAETGRISGSFFSDESIENTGSYESGWREGATPLSFRARTLRSAKIMGGKLKALLAKIRAKLSTQLQRLRAFGRRVVSMLRTFVLNVKTRVRAIAGRVKAAASRGWQRVRGADRAAPQRAASERVAKRRAAPTPATAEIRYAR